MMYKSEKILSQLVRLKPQLENEYSLLSMGVFGSLLTEDFNSESDIDILVEFSKPIGWRTMTMEIELEKIFNRKIDLVTKEALKPQLKQNILNSVKYL